MRDSCDDHRIRLDALEHSTLARALRGYSLMQHLDDGTYDAFIVWAQARDDGVALECTITTGEHRGDVINIVTSTFVTRDVLSLVGLPCTLHVDGDAIRVTQ
jgi:hypothetical protein